MRRTAVKISFENMRNALLEEDLVKFNNHFARIVDIYGKGIKFSSINEFDEVMKDDSIPLII